MFRYLDILTTPFSHMTDILSSTPFTPLGIFVKSSFPRAFWHMSKVQLSVPVTDRSSLRRNKVHYEPERVADKCHIRKSVARLSRSSHLSCTEKLICPASLSSVPSSKSSSTVTASSPEKVSFSETLSEETKHQN